jgi:two-component system nitrate/nitrite response regulator NarL
MKTIALALQQGVLTSALKFYIESHSNYSVCIAAKDGADLLKKIEEMGGSQPDLCIFDVRMQPLNGYKTMQRLKEKWPGIKAMALTDLEHPIALMLMLQHGANGYAITNNDFPMLLQIIDEVCDGIISFPQGLHYELNKILKKNKVRNGSWLFSGREYSMLELCGMNYTCKEIAGILNVGERTIETYFKRIFLKLNIKTRVELALFMQYIGISHYGLPTAC